MSKPTPSIARNSFARLASDGGHLALAFVSGIVTARWLEPDGKGAYAALVSLVMIFASVASLGLGDAAVILIGRSETTFKRMTRATLAPILGTSAVCAVALGLLAGVQLADQGPTLGRSVLIAALTVPLACLWNVSSALANARELIVATSKIRVAVHAVTFFGLLLFVVALGLHVTGGMLALMLSSAFGFAAVASVLVRSGGRFGFSLDLRLLARALRLGLVIELAHSLLVVAARIDVLFVYAIVGRGDAGRYSVALTVGQLVSSASLAVSFALFPRVARIADDESFPLIAKASRVGLAVSLLSALLLLVLIPVALPLTFGAAYRRSVLPALILLLGGIFSAEQHLLATARTARGRTRLQLAAYGTTLVVMIGFDLLLIPAWGIEGAAIASVMGPAAGLTICVVSYARDATRRGVSLLRFLPRTEDFLFVLRSVPALLRRAP